MKKGLHARTGIKASANNDINFLQAEWPAIVGIFLIPFLVLYWLVPFVGKHTIGNDYRAYWIQMQMFLQFSIKGGTFPLYAPGFNGGWTSSALTLGQLWHPISWLASVIPGYWNGFAHEIGTLLRLLLLGGTQLAIFLFLRRLYLARVVALVVSFIAVYNLRMLDMFRYGASLENYLGYLLLCTAVCWHYIEPTKRTGPVCIVLSTWLLVVGGHPQIMYFGLLAAGLVCIVFPFYISDLLPGEVPLGRRKIWNYWGGVSLYVVLGILLASPYTLSFYFEYLSESYRGAGIDFNWACSHQDTLVGSLCNFFNPFYSDVHGAFGGSVLIMMAALMPLLLLLRVRVPWSVVFIWLVCLITFILILGSNGPLYYYFWEYFPFARTFRVPGRLGMAFSFMGVLILAWMVRLEAIKVRVKNRELSLQPAAVIAVLALILFVILRSFKFEGFAQREYWPPVKINKIPSIATLLDFAAGAVSLAALIFYSSVRRFKAAAAGLLAAAVLLQIGVVLRYGTWVAPGRVKTPTYGRMQVEQSRQFGFKWASGDLTRRILEEHLTHTFFECKIARVCPKYTVIGSREEAYERLARERAIDHVFVENYSVVGGGSRQSAADTTDIDKVKLSYNSFNNLKFDAECAEAGFFVFSYPYSEYWRAYVNNKRVPIYRCNGIEQGIWLASGRHTVEFRYWSLPVAVGVAIGCLAVFLTALILLRDMRYGLSRCLAMIAVMCVCVSVFLIWYHSLYNGRNINTNYLWTSEDVQPHLLSIYNLAYGKPTAMSGPFKSYSKVSSCGVDGDRMPESGFVTNVQERAWWQVDLGQVESIGEIVLYKRIGGYERNSLPLDILASADGKQWFFVQTIEKDDNEDYWRVRLQEITARYIRLQTRYSGCLALAEVEIYKSKVPGDRTGVNNEVF